MLSVEAHAMSYHIFISFQLRDLFYFIVILSVFIVSFGVGFQALLDPHEPSSWYTLVGVLWRSYWQMYGELFVGEDGLGNTFSFM